MVDRFPDPPALADRRWSRSWHNYEQYQVVHQNHMEALVSEGTVVRDTILFRESWSASSLVEVNVRGRVHTISGAILTVNKWLEVETLHGRVSVRTREYDYHAHLAVAGRPQNLFRYDNCHGDVESLHKHEFDVGGD